jgi:predicted ribosome quality control (RQC) complex YloA/Tae2 family protein
MIKKPMDKIKITSTVIYYIVKKLNEELLLGYINSVQTIDKDVWKIKIHKQKTKELIVTENICIIPENSFPVTNILGFEKYLKKKLANQRIKEIYQHKNNKVICFKLDHYNLIFELFSNSNIILTDLEFKIITSKQKEEWKDRTIQKGATYLFPSGEDIKLKTTNEINTEIKAMNKSETIKYLSKNYNIAPVELNEILNDNRELIKGVFDNYNLPEPGLKYISEKNTYIVSNKGENIFKTFENIYATIYEKKEIVKESKKKNKIIDILTAQKSKKEEFENNIKQFDAEGEFIYTNFALVDAINIQIKKALDQKTPEKEIIAKINTFFKNKKIKLKINKINQKTKLYEIENLE